MSGSEPRSEGGDDRPGAAFGIPEGATGEEVVDVVLGAGGSTDPDGSGGRGGRGGRDGRDGIDPELLPYLEAADAEDSNAGEVGEVGDGGGAATAERRAAAENQDLEALRELVAASMIPGGDPERLDALLAEVDADESDDWNEWEPQLPDSPAASGPYSPYSPYSAYSDEEGESDEETERHRADLLAAARAVEVSARMREVEAEILSRAPEHQVQPSLERVEAVLDLLGNPERTYRTVHITGTNGKTSTARMTERLLAAGGMRTGRFTSPHLATIRERISLDGEPISEEDFIAAWEDVAPYVAMVDERSQADGGPRLSFFEVLAVMALAAFADYPVDVAVIEVGLGGRWDATNVIGSDVAVITPIGRDHERWLGSSITEIAHEKAGVIKDGSTVIVAHQVPDAAAEIDQAVVSHRAIVRRERDPQGDPASPEAGVLQVLDRQLAVGGQMVTFATAAAVYEDAFVPLHGEYQAHNALLALAAAEAIHGGRRLPARIVEDGFASVTSPGRLEVLRSSPTVLVDAAHNPHGIEALTGAIEEAFGFQHLVAVLGVMADKDAEGILAGLEPVTDAVVCVPIDSPRAMDVDDLGGIAQEVYGADRVVVSQQLGEGVAQAVALSEGYDTPLTSSGILIVGSVVLAAEARALFGRP